MAKRIFPKRKKLIASFRGSEKDKENRSRLNVAIRTASQKVDAVQQKRKRLYEDYVEGVLDVEEYTFAKKAYEGEYEEWSSALFSRSRIANFSLADSGLSNSMGFSPISSFPVRAFLTQVVMALLEIPSS